MTEEKREILSKVNALIQRRKEELLKKLPNVHKVEDAVIIRFFTEWDNCNDNEKIKYKRVKNLDKPEEIVLFYYLPKGAYFELKQRDYIYSIACLNGKLEIEYDDKIRILDTNTKICLESNIFEGRALENSYIVTTNKV